MHQLGGEPAADLGFTLRFLGWWNLLITNLSRFDQLVGRPPRVL